MPEVQGPEIAAVIVFSVCCAAVGLGGLALIHLATWYLGTGKKAPGKLEPYECGVPLLSSSRQRFGVKFYLVALLFILFDIETVFLLPYAVTARQLGWEGFVEMLVFVAVLGLGLLYLYWRGALEWEK